MVWVSMLAAVLWLWTESGRCDVQNGSHLVEYSAEGFSEKLQSGSTMFVYFGHRVSPTISLFLVQLDKSAEALQDYGIVVGKVNCSLGQPAKFCTGERLLKKVYLFRNAELLKSFDVDSVFDINAIVAHVLFGVLFDEVRYAQSVADLQALERAAWGRSNVVLAYVQMLGTQEHRSLMETVFVYGAKHQFVLTTGGPLLEQLGMDPGLTAGVWFLHCRLLQGPAGSGAPDPRCPRTPMRRPLSTLDLHGFLRLMEAPLVTEVREDPSSVHPHHTLLQTPQLFLFCRPSTEHPDRAVATTLAWRLRGLALLMLVHRESPAVKTPEEFNVAYRLPGQGSGVKYLTLTNLEEVVGLFNAQERAGGHEEEEGEEEEEEEEREHADDWSELDMLDDEVAESVFRSRGVSLDMDAVTLLNSDNFLPAVAEHSLTVALFYLKWDAVSMAVLSKFIEVADRLADSEVAGVQMGVVDCGEWTDLCAAQPMAADRPYPFQPIRAFPSVLLLRPQETAQRYRGMLGSEALHRFILVSLVPSPLLLSTQEEVRSFLQEVPGSDLSACKPDRVLGLFKTTADPRTAVFSAAATALRGEVLAGMLTDSLAESWAAGRSQSLSSPEVLLYKASDAWAPAPPDLLRPLPLPLPASAEELVALVNAALLHQMPELTVANLPSYLALGRPLLLLFVGSEEEEEEEDEWARRETQAVLREVRAAAGGRGEGGAEGYLPCWIHLGRTPAGASVLRTYLGSLPPLPALVLSQLPSGELYHYPSHGPIVARSVLHWLEGIRDGTEPPTGTMGDDGWRPAAPLYDFLSVMDHEAPGYARPSSPRAKTGDGEEGGGREEGGGEREAQPSRPPWHAEL
ncbi:thioredoxin domain-containing protein 16 [Gadus macrocephalus]|uniref:thioredoxin domain-containing protein 16 n=1 Tax=Gadus macrocephalus TaxID=80720 RepID=UPI0028CB1A43|nr:thioredoxin domain-containing protein 16 [Gadus macrocephalus]